MKDGLSHPKLEAMAKMYKMDNCSNVEVVIIIRMDVDGGEYPRDDNIMIMGDPYPYLGHQVEFKWIQLLLLTF